MDQLLGKQIAQIPFNISATMAAGSEIVHKFANTYLDKLYTAYAKRSGRGALGRNFRKFLQNFMYGIFISLFFFGGGGSAKKDWWEHELVDCVIPCFIGSSSLHSFLMYSV